ncbi:hypothetical protein Enr13x_71900 [Stieleria neptunia]|uniref:Uncharacterized protein n=1 Tax=Stieleria neptunia TaxID=2527979 RepID=A0A518HX57_9BACT|nr:hypothetical protein [Stieleria neptunia]QDV45438.1 hypothetical protein Enr13x_53170 [Stieleria neptunia]QDV47281.1 hypothetical protein Enr13x_71900 [Stieleria neptunia]
MPWFDGCAVDSAGEDKPTPDDFNADDRRLTCRLQIGTPEFPLAIRIEYIGKPRRSFQTGVPTDATNPAMHPSTLVAARHKLSPRFDHHAHANSIVEVCVRGDR